MMLFIKKKFFFFFFKIKFYMKMFIFNSFLLLLRWLKGGKIKAKNGLTSLFIYLLYNSK